MREGSGGVLERLSRSLEKGVVQETVERASWRRGRPVGSVG